MRKRAYKQALLASIVALTIVVSAFVVAPTTNVHAQNANRPAAPGRPTDAGRQGTDKKPEAQQRLAEAKLKACQKRETAINNIMARIANRGEKHLDVFNKIAERTEAFYVAKGKTLSNYEALVADVDAKRAAAQAAVDAIKATSVSFKCDGTDPKGMASSFKDSLRSEIAALKAYKTAVKNLIVGVKSVQETIVSTDTKPQGDQQ